MLNHKPVVSLRVANDNRLLDKCLSLELEYQKQLNRSKYKEVLNKVYIIIFFLFVTLLSYTITYN